MASCNKDAKAKNLAGDERKKFMKTCLSNSAPPVLRRRPKAVPEYSEALVRVVAHRPLEQCGGL